MKADWAARDNQILRDAGTASTLSFSRAASARQPPDSAVKAHTDSFSDNATVALEEAYKKIECTMRKIKEIESNIEMSVKFLKKNITN